MCMTLILDYWETVSLTAGCNLYSTHFRLCVLTVRTAHQAGQQGGYSSRQDTNMYFRERDKPVVDAETFLATSVPKILISTLIIFLNLMAIVTMCRSNKLISKSTGRQKGFYILPQSTQGLLHSLFLAYLSLGLLTLYSQVSLSVFVLGEYRLFEDQGKECLTVNSLMIALSLSIALHLVSLAVDRILASSLPYGKYTSLSQGTVPLWLLSIWLPSMILGFLPLAGWRSNFSFCIFLHQFKDDYIRFVSGFYLTTLFLIPCLYIFFVTVLKPRREEPPILYRWHRKLQAHHRLTFALVLVVNIICWTPFHCYLLIACLTCSHAYLASGFTLEYLYMLALVPSIIIPLMFSIRSNAVDKCANKISKCVHFLDDPNHRYDDDWDDATTTTSNNNPLANVKRSPLFFIDDAIQQHQREQQQKNFSVSSSADNSNPGSWRRQQSLQDEADGTLKKSNFFAPHYLPTSTSLNNEEDEVGKGSSLKTNKKKKGKQKEEKEDERKMNVSLKKKNNSSKNNNNNNNSSSKKNNVNGGIYEGIGSLRTAPLRNFCAYLNTKNNAHNQSFRSSDSKYGFPIPSHPSVNIVNMNTNTRANSNDTK